MTDLRKSIFRSWRMVNVIVAVGLIVIEFLLRALGLAGFGVTRGVVGAATINLLLNLWRYSSWIDEFASREIVPPVTGLENLPVSEQRDLWRQSWTDAVVRFLPVWLLLFGALWFGIGILAVSLADTFLPAWRPTNILFGVCAGFPAVLAILYLTTLVARLYVRRELPHLCTKCGYDLRGTPDRCPECGTIPADDQRRRITKVE